MLHVPLHIHLKSTKQKQKNRNKTKTTKTNILSASHKAESTKQKITYLTILDSLMFRHNSMIPSGRFLSLQIDQTQIVK